MHDVPTFKPTRASVLHPDISRIGGTKKKLPWLVENKIFDLQDVPVES
jgi:hypothetical protein